MKRIAVDGLPDDPLAAAAAFHAEWLARIEEALVAGEDVLLHLPSADHTHRQWRRAAVAGLARKHTPRRVVMVAGSGDAIAASEAYLAGAPGITGQYLET